jgi:aspartate racemase
VAAGLYQKALKAAGVKCILPDANTQKSLMELIYRIKSGDTGDTSRRVASTIARKLEAQGAEVIIAGCTEIPIVLTADDIDGELVNSTDVLVERTIVFAGAELKA